MAQKADQDIENILNISSVFRKHRSLYPDHDGDASLGWMPTLLTKATTSPREGESGQATNLGTMPHPYDFAAVKRFLTSNEHHSTCIAAKVSATVGLGFQTEEDRRRIDIRDGIDPQELDSLLSRKRWEPTKVDEILDPLCMHSFQDLLCDVAEDYHLVNNGYIEVVRDSNNRITGLHYLPAEQTYIFVENTKYDLHYEIQSPEGVTRRFAAFGDKDSFLKRAAGKGGAPVDFDMDPNTPREEVSEVIHFRRPSSLDRWYGIPKWLSCAATIELVQMLTQFKFDFFLNRGVPEFMLFVMGTQLHGDDWKKIEDSIKAGIGSGNAFKSLACNIASPEVKIQLERLMADMSSENAWASDNEACALKIVSAHQVPPLLAGIQIPGKLGATNELPNALMAFQSLVIGQDQRIFERRLASTLGNQLLNGGLRLEPKDFVLRTILEEIDIGRADTVSRMRQTVPEARAEGRNLDDGVKD